MASQEEQVTPPEETEGKDDGAKFAGAWDELEAEESGQPALAAGHQDDDAAGEAQGGDEAGQVASGDTPGTDADKASRGEISDDVLAGADPAVKALVESEREERRKAQNLARANGGRLAQSLNELAALRSKLAPSRDEQAAGEGGATNRDERLEQLREEYPEVAGPILDHMLKLEERIGAIGAAETSRAESAVVEALGENMTALLERHPDLSNIVADGSGYKEWLATKAPAIRRIVQENAEAVVNAEDAAQVFDLFKYETGFGQAAAPTPEQERAAAKRANQLEAGRSATGGTQPGVRSDTSTGGGSFSDEWDKLDVKDRNKAASRR